MADPYLGLNYRGTQLSYQPDSSGLSTTLPAVGSASDTFAQLTRDQWADYVQRFVPAENRLISYALSPETVQANMDAAGTQVDQSFGQVAGAQERALRGYGLPVDPAQQAAAARATDLAHGLTKVQAINNARDATVDRQLGVLSGSSGSPKVPIQGVQA